MHHYTESGLDDVWLTNGYTLENIDEEEYLSISDVDGLHRAIGKSLSHRPELTGKQFRFLRKELDLSQVTLAQMLGVSVEAVSLWERTGNIAPMGQRLLQSLYLERVNGNPKISDLLKEIADLDREIADLDSKIDDLKLVFEDGWKEAA